MPASAPTATATAGFVVARLLLKPPDGALLDRLADRAGRRTWPLHNPASVAALRLLDDGFSSSAVGAEWQALLGGPTPAVRLRESEWTGADEPELSAELVARYRDAGLGLTQFGAAEPDQLGVELHYLAHLAAVAAKTDTDSGGAAEIAAFRSDHVDRFCSLVLDELRARAHTPLLAALPGLVDGFLEGLDAQRPQP
ncbi:MAG: molecular chaperone TorD family protein [Micropruina sp.]|nr:molecular chaperone TorD family protein [Micropruina sp.]